MTQVWKCSWNKNLYDYKRIIEDFRLNQVSVIKQSKGNAKMVNLPQIGDIVFVSCNKKKIMKCRVISDFITDDEQHNDPYNIGENRLHSMNNTYLNMSIIEIYDDPQDFRGCQRTWSKL